MPVSWLCAVHPSCAKWSTLSDLAPRGGRSTWNWDSMGEGGTCLVPSIAISLSLLCLAGCLFTTVWQEAVSLCQLISHFSINIVKWPIFLFVSFSIKKNVCCYPGEVDFIRRSCGKSIKFPEMLRGVWHLLVMWAVLLPAVRQLFLLTTSPVPAQPSICNLGSYSWTSECSLKSRSNQRVSGR